MLAGLLAKLIKNIAVTILHEKRYCNIVGNIEYAILFTVLFALISKYVSAICKCKTEFSDHY